MVKSKELETFEQCRKDHVYTPGSLYLFEKDISEEVKTTIRQESSHAV